MLHLCYIKSQVIHPCLRIAGIVFLFLTVACKNDNSPQEDHSMHISADNTRKTADTAVDQTYWNTLPANRTVISSQQVVAPTWDTMDFALTGNGYIDFDYRRNRKVSIRAGGRIEKLYVKYNYQYVRKGEKILDLYSPELNTYVEEFLFINRQSQDTLLQNASMNKLLLLGLTRDQIKQMGQTGRADLTVPVYSPSEGYVLFKAPEPGYGANMESGSAPSGEMTTGMDNDPAGNPSNATTQLPGYTLREGMYLSKGQTICWLNDFKEVWGIIALTKGTERYIRKGMPAVIQSELLPEQPIRASVQLVEQIYQRSQKFTQVRVALNNNRGVLRQNSLITAVFPLPARSFVVPASSVYYLGNVSIVWVRRGITQNGNNVFQARVVKTGRRTANEIEILEGLDQEEHIARDAAYLADSETIITY